ncbi:hypothetical protein TRFO_02532 [Tritrichomonas foetus]|uniref:Gamma tubulin complex component C-terminal domain-containing protein n=1 Tax=Tritrichomonas foetus TaxID=1144522 RepID=A0A1J4L6D0_9EUKA|nr:hypothetical protein TRFO_02532 [Tritrichomonas foetus]|eukprot:OHT17501.1 hypothetical protein TRFO_02532 [Tritrichomonas foetus]
MRLWAAAFQEFARPIYSLAFLSDVDKDPIFQTVFEPIQFDVAAAGRLLRLLREAVPSHPLFDLADEYMERFLKLENCVEEYQKKCQQSILNIENKWNEYHKDNFNQRMKEFEMEKFEIRDRLHQTEMILLLKMKENMKEKQERLAILQKEIDTFDKLRRKKEAEEKQENKEYIDNLVANKAVTPIFRPMSTEEQIMVEREKLDLFMEFRQQMIDLGASEEHIMSFFPDLNLPENELEALGINYHSDESIYEEEEEKETFFKLLIDEEAKNDSKVEIKENQNIEKSEIEQKENYFQDMKHSKEESKEDIKEIFRPKIRRPNFYGKDDDSKPTTFEEFMEDEKKRKESRPKTFAEFVEDERKRNEDKPKTFDEFIEDEQRRGLRTGPLKSQKNEEKIDNTIVIGQEIQEELQDLAELNLGIDDEEEEEDDRKQIKKYTKCAQNLDDDDDSLMETQMITRPKVRFQQNIIDEASRTNQRNTNRNLNNDNNRESSQNINITNTQNISDNVASHDPNDNQDSNNNDNINPTPQNANQEQDNHDNNPNNSSINHKNEDNDDEIVVNAPPLKTIPALFHRLVIPSFKIHYRVVSMALFSIFKSRNEFQRQITALSKTFLITACSETDEFVKLFSDIPYGPGSFIRIGKSFANIATNLNFDGTIQIGTASEPPTSVADIIERINVMPVEVKPNPIFNLLLTSSIIQCYISMFRVILMLKLARAAVDKMWFLTRDSYMHRPDSRASALMLRFVTCTETYFHATALAPAAKALEQVCEGVETIEECNKKHEDILRNLLTMSLLNPNTKAIRTPLLQSLVEICKYVYEPLISGKKVSIDDFEDSAGKFALILHELNSAISENEMFRFLDTLFADFMIR